MEIVLGFQKQWLYIQECGYLPYCIVMYYNNILIIFLDRFFDLLKSDRCFNKQIHFVVDYDWN